MPAAKRAAADAEVEVELVEARVAPGRSVHVDGGDYGPGTAVFLPGRELERLALLGFLVAPPAQVGPEQEEAAASSEPPAGATVQVQDGARVYQG